VTVTERPFDQIVVKLCSRCPLACDYCYVYEHADQRWRHQPRLMSHRTIDRLADRLAEQAERQGMAAPRVILHGGEPLLAGTDLIRYLTRTVRAALPRTAFLVQTNGVLLTKDMLDVLAEEQVSVGVSLDGGRAATDRHRRYAGG
jgi:uncharacterized protein